MKDDWDREEGTMRRVLLNPDHTHAQDGLENVYYSATSSMTPSPSTRRPFVSITFILGLSFKLAATHENAGRYRAGSSRWRPMTARRRS
jgi:hypothetical protein